MSPYGDPGFCPGCNRPRQDYYWTPEWQRDEKRSLEEIKAGLSKVFESLEEVLAWLKQPESSVDDLPEGAVRLSDPIEAAKNTVPAIQHFANSSGFLQFSFVGVECRVGTLLNGLVTGFEAALARIAELESERDTLRAEVEHWNLVIEALTDGLADWGITLELDEEKMPILTRERGHECQVVRFGSSFHFEARRNEEATEWPVLWDALDDLLGELEATDE